MRNNRVGKILDLREGCQTEPLLQLISGQGCPRCHNKAEGKLAISLNNRAITHRSFRIESRYFDFFLPDFNLLIERDGEQHYPAIWNIENIIFGRSGLTYIDEQEIDEAKTSLAKKHRHKIARIPYWLNDEEIKIEIDNILSGRPTYPDIPDPKQESTKPKPIKN